MHLVDYKTQVKKDILGYLNYIILVINEIMIKNESSEKVDCSQINLKLEVEIGVFEHKFAIFVLFVEIIPSFIKLILIFI